MKVTVGIIALDEEHNIGRLLQEEYDQKINECNVILGK